MYLHGLGMRFCKYYIEYERLESIKRVDEGRIISVKAIN